MFNQIEKLASAIHNDIVAGLRGYHANMSLSIDLLMDDVVDERLQILKEYSARGVLPREDLYLSINCIPIDCKSIDDCRCQELDECSTPPMAHFELPQTIEILYIGAIDKSYQFIIYESPLQLANHLYRKRGKNKPYVYIDRTPNKNNMYDCYVFNAPFLEKVSVIAIFKDLRQLENFECCQEFDNFSFINNEIKRRLTLKKINYYKQGAPFNLPNNQEYSIG